MKIKRAHSHHAIQAARLIRLSGEAAFDHIFSEDHGPKNTVFLSTCFSSPHTVFSHKHHFVIAEDNNVMAIISLVTKKDHDQSFLSTAWYIFKNYGLRSIFKGSKFEMKLVKPPKKEVLYIAHVAVHESQRGKGLGQQLIQFSINTALNRGIKTLALDVRADNYNAIALYELYGFKQMALNKSYHTSLNDHLYMEKQL